MTNDYKGVEHEYDVKFCTKCKGMELFRLIDGKWKCEKCKKRINKNRRRKSDENIKA